MPYTSSEERQISSHTVLLVITPLHKFGVAQQVERYHGPLKLNAAAVQLKKEGYLDNRCPYSECNVRKFNQLIKILMIIFVSLILHKYRTYTECVFGVTKQDKHVVFMERDINSHFRKSRMRYLLLMKVNCVHIIVSCSHTSIILLDLRFSQRWLRRCSHLPHIIVLQLLPDHGGDVLLSNVGPLRNVWSWKKKKTLFNSITSSHFRLRFSQFCHSLKCITTI
jgi:hypothetical protein